MWYDSFHYHHGSRYDGDFCDTRWRPTIGAITRTCRASFARTNIAMSPDGRHSVIVTYSSVLIRSGQAAHTTVLKYSPVRNLWHGAFSPNGNYLVVLPCRGYPYMWSVCGDIFTELEFVT